MLITKTMLKRMKACKPEYDLFVEMFPDGAEWNDRENIRKAYNVLSLEWFVDRCNDLGIISDDEYESYNANHKRIICEWSSSRSKIDHGTNNFRSVSSVVDRLHENSTPENVIAAGKLLVKLGEDAANNTKKIQEESERIEEKYQNDMIALFASIPLRSFPRKKKS